MLLLLRFDPQQQEAGQNHRSLLWLNVLKVTTFKICGDSEDQRREEEEEESTLLHLHHQLRGRKVKQSMKTIQEQITSERHNREREIRNIPKNCDKLISHIYTCLCVWFALTSRSCGFWWQWKGPFCRFWKWSFPPRLVPAETSQQPLHEFHRPTSQLTGFYLHCHQLVKVFKHLKKYLMNWKYFFTGPRGSHSVFSFSRRYAHFSFSIKFVVASCCSYEMD